MRLRTSFEQQPLAETCFELHDLESSESLLQELFQIESIEPDQFHCLAHLIYAQVIAKRALKYLNLKRIDLTKEALQHVTSALDLAVKKGLPHMIFNCSLIAWRISHPLMTSGRAKYIAAFMTKIALALESAQEEDRIWRIEFLSATAYCCAEEDNKGTLDFITKASQLIEGLLKEYSLQENNLKSDLNKIISEYKLLKSHPIDLTSEETDVIDVESEINRLQELKTKAEVGLRDLKQRILELRNKQLTLYLQRIHYLPNDAKKFISTPEISNSMYVNVSCQLQCITSGIIPEKDRASSLNSTIAIIENASKLKAKPNPSLISECFVDVARVAYKYGLMEVANKCFTKATTETVGVDPRVKTKIDVYRAVLLANDASLEASTEHSVSAAKLTDDEVETKLLQRRLEALKSLERLLPMAINIPDTPLAVEICTHIWNIGVPFLHTNLRQHMYRYFTSAVAYLDKVSCHLLALRAQFHYEIAKVSR